MVVIGTAKNSRRPRSTSNYVPRGQDESAINIMLTCRTYYIEGRKIFWEHNIFRFQSIRCLRAYLPAPRCDWIRHLSIHVHVGVRKTADIADLLVSRLEVLRVRTALKTLQIHLINTAGSYNYLAEESFGDAIYRSLTLAAVWYAVYHLQAQRHPSESGFAISRLALEEVIITGLPDDELKLDALMLRLASTMVSPHGRIGLGMGDEGRQYWAAPRATHPQNKTYRINENPKLEWVHAADVDNWVSKHAWDRDLSARSPAGASLYLRLWGRFWRHPFYKGWL